MMGSGQSSFVAGSHPSHGPPSALVPAAVGHVTGDDRNTHPGSAHQGVSATEMFSRQVKETAQELKEHFDKEANDKAQKVCLVIIFVLLMLSFLHGVA